VLKDRLHAIGVEVNIETFEEDQGIIGLGENPFVSYSQYCYSGSIHSKVSILSQGHGSIQSHHQCCILTSGIVCHV